MALLDVMLTGLSLPGNSLATVGTEQPQDTPRSRQVRDLSLLLSVVLVVFVEESSPLSLTPGARELVLTQLAAKDDQVLVVLLPRVELAEVAPDGVQTELVSEPETRPAQSLVGRSGTQLAHHVALGPHLLPSLLPVAGEVLHSDLLVVGLAVVLDQLPAEQSLSFRIVTPGFTLGAGQQDVVVVLHVVLQLSQLFKVLLAGWALQ